ncbi:MAG TPA: lamin tail domain-containing protein, partial [Verrucomicrobiae bacterium]|nr:lamin tail domain-containing protein [Verrucomicrobiae bacterium]
RNDYSFARLPGANAWRYFRTPTPGAANGTSLIDGVTPDVHFSVKRGFFNTPFNLTLASDMPGAVIRYTLDGTPPTETGGLAYTGPILVDRTRMIRAAAFSPNRIPSGIATHTFFFNLSAGVRSLPAISIVTANSNLFGSSGIMETSPRNTVFHGIAWERPVSVEYIQPSDNGGFAIDAGLRIQGGGYVRDRYDPNGSLPFSKYSFRLYFRGDYGASQLEFPLVPDSPVEVFDKIVLRAGMNDHSNPFIRDELVRRLYKDMGQVSSLGTLTTFFLNGLYKGYYNPCERIDPDFLQSWHGGGDAWDVIAQFGEIQEGDAVAWNSLRNFVNASDLSVNAAYQEAARRLDVTNFVDYLLVNIYAAMGDWPHNNWRAARERVAGSRFRYYVWDAEWAFGFSNPVSHNTFNNELNGTTEVATFYKKLRASAEFRLLFADRIHKHFFNSGALSDARVLAGFTRLRTNMAGILPGMSTAIQTSWVPQRRGIIMPHFNAQGLLASSNAPAFSQHGGKVRRGFDLTMSALAGTIYYTTNGTDPRLAFSGAISTEAIVYSGAPARLDASTMVKARTLNGGNWSALAEAEFSVAEIGLPIRITEIMYNPPGGDAYEFIEIHNAGSTAVDLGLMSFVGVDFQFPENTTLVPGATMVLSSNDDPAAFASRYPGTVVTGQFGGSLANGGEKVALLDMNGNEVVAVTYGDADGWPKQADGSGYSLEIADANGDPNAPANWRISTQLAGSPGALTTSPPPPAAVVINEVMAENLTAVPNGGAFADWVELFNGGAQTIDLGGWRVGDEGSEFVFPAGTTIAATGYLVVWCDTDSAAPGLHTGFGLGRNGDSLFLYDASSNRVDAVSFGLQIADLTIGRVGEWKLTQPTPNAANVPVTVGAQTSLRLNEWLANSVPGSDDWIELFNTDAANPVGLRNVGFATSSGAAFQVRSLSFVPPGGYALLDADENPGADHVGFKLPAAATTLLLYDETGLEVDRASYGVQTQGVSQGRLPDGTANIASFPATPSPGAANYTANYSGPVLNEVLARNAGATANAEGRFVDWVELFNPNPAAFDLSGMRLSDDRDSVSAWTFPAGTTLPANGHLVVWFDNERPASVGPVAALNVGRALNGSSGGVYLFNSQGQVVDSVEYGFQVADLSIGRSGGAWRLLASPTRGNANSAPATLGSGANLRLNEWMADPLSGNDWFEIYNTDSLSVELSGLYVSDDPSIVGATRHRIPALSFIAGGGWAKWEADNAPDQGAHHVNFALDRLGQTLRLYNTAGGIIDGIDFGPQSVGASSGRLSDGQSNVVQFATTPTPDSSNYLPLPDVVINEVLSHTDPPLEDAVELMNRSDSPLDIGGWYLSDDPADLRKFQIAPGTILPAGSYKVFYEGDLSGGAGSLAPFNFNSARGDAVHLSQTNGNGGLTGFRAVAEFGPAANGVSFGRYATSVGTDFVAMSRHSFGVGTPSSVPQFRTGGGAVNAYPLVGPIVVSEIMYLPTTTVGTNTVEIAEEEYLELQNLSANPVPLFDPAHPTNTWRLAGGIEFAFPAGVTIPAQGFLLVVNFDPATNAVTASAFRMNYGVPGQVSLCGPFGSRL